MDLIITFDYELFGDGTGDVFTHVVEPTTKILNICEMQNIKVVIFFEVLEYLKLKEEWDKGNRMGYLVNPIEAIKNQIQNAALKGHDIQLHIHPQWQNAKYENGKWILDFSNWRLGDFKGGGLGVRELIKECKESLEALIKPVLPNYECIGLRAGGYNIMPSKDVCSAMQSLGIKFDSSVYPGGYENTSLSAYDYRQVPISLDYWWGESEDIRLISNFKEGVVEIPIFSLPIPRWKRLFTWQKIRTLMLGQNNAISSLTMEKFGKKSFKDKILYLFKTEATTWDVCLFSKTLHRSFFKYIETNLVGKRKSYVLIGHPKSLVDEKVFASFFTILNNRKYSYRFKTLTEQYEESVNRLVLVEKPSGK